MKIGVVYPQLEFGADPSTIKEYVQLAESLGYTHLLAYDHVLGANPNREGGWQGPYTHQDTFHDPFVLFSYMAALTTELEFVTGILILPQRETAVVAKQAATLDLLSNGRFRMGVGVGWNKIEYVALNQNFHTRGKRMDEQLPLLRQLWQEELVTFEGKWHTIPDAGLNPRPTRHIPIWMGGHADVVLRRVAKYGDGWLPNFRQGVDAQPSLEKLASYIQEAGRSMDEIGIEPRIHLRGGTPESWKATLEGWQQAGATHITLNTMGCGFDTTGHLEAIQQFADLFL